MAATTARTMTDLTRMTKRDRYGQLDIELSEALEILYPKKLTVSGVAPGCWGGNPDISLSDKPNQDGRWVLYVPSGSYSSNKHFHSSNHGILTVESPRKKLNLAGRPLVLLVGVAYNGDYRSLTKGYFLLGMNEDSSFFLHKVMPNAAEGGDMDKIRQWIWRLKGDEVVAARQGDLAFIPKRKPAGTVSPEVSGWWNTDERGREFHSQAVTNCPAGKSLLMQGNHAVYADEVRHTANRAYVLNPVASHGEHDAVQLEGWHEVRLGRAWGASTAD